MRYLGIYIVSSRVFKCNLAYIMLKETFIVVLMLFLVILRRSHIAVDQKQMCTNVNLWSESMLFMKNQTLKR